MSNRDTRAALEYHERTKHSYYSVRANEHYLDWDNRPLPFKIYSTLAPIPLPRIETPLPMSALDAISASPGEPEGTCLPDLESLSRILFLSNGVHRVRRFGNDAAPSRYSPNYHERNGAAPEFSFRTASCTGALYHIELYLVCRDLPELSAGIYHYGAHDHALRRLRSGDYRAFVVRATGSEHAVARSPLILICTDTFWRNAWKYQEREYRHTFWDNGVILANLLAAATALDLPARVICGFADEEINRLLSLDVDKEVAVSLVALGREREALPEASASLAPLNFPTEPLSRYEVDYPLIRETHAASSLTLAEVESWRGEPPRVPMPTLSGPVFPLAPLSREQASRDPLDAVILRRGSSRQFARQPITFAQLSTMLIETTRGVPTDYLVPFGTTLNDLYLIVNAVEGLPSGSYVYHREAQALEQLQTGNFRQRAGYLGLEQELPRDASVNIYYLANLDPILERFGNRGYRAAQLEAGILGGKLYLAAYALGLGATGLTFYDDDVIKFFSPHAAGKSVMFLMNVGVPRREKRNSRQRN